MILQFGRWKKRAVTPLDRCTVSCHIGGVINKRMQNLWACRLPMKLKVFLCLANNRRLQTGTTLKHKSWKGDANCHICNTAKTVNHIFFHCVIARFVWTCFKEILGWERIPVSLDNIFDHWIQQGCTNRHLKLFTFTIVVWVLFFFEKQAGALPNHLRRGSNVKTVQ